MNFTQNFVVDIKCSEGNNAGYQNLEGSRLKFPILLHSYAQSIDHKKQKQNAMNLSNDFH